MRITDGFGLVPLPGGHSGETFVADAAGDRTVVRIYADRGARRGPEAPQVDAAVLQLVRGLLPVPEVLEVRRPDPQTGSPGLLVTSYLPGQRLELVLPDLDDAGMREVGHNLGLLLARLAQMPMPRAGMFVDGDLRITPFPVDDLADFVEDHRRGTALETWPAEDYDGLLAVAERAQTALEPVVRTCLVHGDFNPKNVLVDPETLQVTGLLDWEFAHAGLPGSDLGNLLRFDRDEAFCAAVLGAYRARVADATDAVLDQARAADLVALVDLAARRGENLVTERAHDLLRAVAVSGNLHAWSG